MSGRSRQIIAIILIVVFWMPVVILPSSVGASGAIEISDSPSLSASILSFVWSKAATLLGSAAQEPDDTAPPGMPSLQRPRRHRSEPPPSPSKAEREAKVARLKVSHTGSITLQPGQELVLGAIPLDGDGNTLHGLVAEWESNHPQIASVTTDGLVTAHQAGKAHLKVKAGSKQELVDVTVQAPTEARTEINRGGAAEIARRSSADRSTGSTEGSAREGVSLSHGRSSRLVRAAAAAAAQQQVIYEDREYITEVGSPPGRTEPGASMPPAAIAGTERPGTANFSFNVPLLDLPGRGIDVSLALSYNSRLWSKKLGTYPPKMRYNVDQGWPAPGFSLGYGKMIWDNTASSVTLVGPDGTRHAMRSTTDDYNGNSFVTTDGTFIYFSRTAAGSKEGTAMFSDGTQIKYTTITQGSTVITHTYPTRITDRNGNYLQLAYNGYGLITSIQDTLGRYIQFYYENNELVGITAPAYDGGPDRPVVRFYYKSIQIDQTLNGKSSFYGYQTGYTQPPTVRVISYVYFPGTGSGYRYDYADTYGMIYKITQLRGMTASVVGLSEPAQMGSITGEGQVAATTTYDYPLEPSNLTDVPKYAHRTDDWAGRISEVNGTPVPAPVYTFATGEATNVSISTITAPDGTQTETQSYKLVNSNDPLNGLVKEITVKKGTATLSKIRYEWEPNIYENMRVKRFWVTNDANQTKATEYEYGFYNSVTKVREFGFDGVSGSPGTELRRTETTYQTGQEWLSRHLLRLPTEVKVFAGGSNVPSSWVKYEYDAVTGASLTQRPALSTHDQAYNPASATYDSATDKRGNLSSVTAYANAAAGAEPIVNTSSYDIFGNVVSQTVNCCRRKTFAYDAGFWYAYTTAETRGDAGQLTTYAGYNYYTGQLISSTDENARTTTYSYYPDSLRPDTISRPDTSYTRYHYYDGFISDGSRLHSYVGTATASGVGTLVWNYEFTDGRGAVARRFDNYTAANGWHTIDVEYDELGRSKRTSNPYYSAGSGAEINPTGLWTTVEQYDELGRTRKVRLPDSTLLQTDYAGTFVTVTDQAGKQRRQVTDALGRLVRVDEPDPSGNLGTPASPTQPTFYEYDALGNLTKVTQTEAGVTQERFFKYDSLSRLTHERQVEATATLDSTGAYVGGAGQWTAIYKYNAQGLRSDVYDARGVHTIFDYDGLNRIHSLIYTGETGQVRTPAVIYTYDEGHDGYFNNGRLTKISTAAVTTAGVQPVPQTVQAYDYDQMGRVSVQRQTVGGSDPYTLKYVYNLLGQLVSEEYPSGRVVGYEYDDGARLNKVKNGSAGNYVSAVTYKAHGGVATMTLGNGAVESVGYNARLQPIQSKLTVGNIERQRFDYEYGEVNLSTGSVNTALNTGQIARIEGWIDGSRQWQQRFRYDALGRLDIAAEHSGTDLQQLWKADYDYDRFGNRIQSGGENQNLSHIAVATTEVNKANNRLTSGLTYDDAGNVTLDSKFRNQAYSYDGNGRQVRVAQTAVTRETTAIYDGLGQRVQMTDNGSTTTLIYDIFGQVVAEYGGQATGTGGTRYVTPDHQGSARVVTNSSGAVLARHDFFPFGEEIQPDLEMRTSGRGYGVADSTRQKYAGMERDTEGLDHTLWRKYESRGGRWTSPDPFGGSMDIGDPQSFNRYSYVGNDPVNMVDPSGLFALPDQPRDPWGFWGILLNPSLGSGGRSGGILPLDPPGTPQNPVKIDIGDPPPNGMGCDLKLAALFGGPGAKVMTTVEPSGLKTPDGKPHPMAGSDRGSISQSGHDARVRPNAPTNTDDRGGIFHIYGDAAGLSRSNGLYIPQGYHQVNITPGENNRRAFTNSEGLTIVAVHVGAATGPNNNTMGSRRIGNIGGPGAGTEKFGYYHSHLYMLRGYDPKKENNQSATRVDPRTVFCKEFGF